MAEVIFETVQRGTRHFHKIASFPVTVGRAFDNDVILSDPTISPHHLIIEKEDDKLFIRNLSTENGTKIGRKKMGDERVEIETPSSFQLSSIKARLLSSDTPVEKTYIKDCSGFFCLLTNPIWAIFSLLIITGLISYEEYLDTHTPKEIYYYLSNVFPQIFGIIGFVVVISIITRLINHRWEIIPAISITALMSLMLYLIDYVGQRGAYLFTSNAVLTYATYFSAFVVFLLIAVFIAKIFHKKWRSALGIAALIYSPFLAIQVTTVLKEASYNSDFSDYPSYNQSLLPGDKRLNATIPLKQFINEANRSISSDMDKLLIEAKKKAEEKS